jgi:hypothetical protein
LSCATKRHTVMAGRRITEGDGGHECRDEKIPKK